MCVVKCHLQNQCQNCRGHVSYSERPDLEVISLAIVQITKDLIPSNEVTRNYDGKSSSLSKPIAVIHRDFVDEDCQIRNHADLFQQPCEVVIFQQSLEVIRIS